MPFPIDRDAGRLDGPERSRSERLGSQAPTVARRAVIDVDVVLVAHGGRDRVLACLDSLPAAADGAVLSVTLVDNGSDDGTLEAVTARQDGTRVIPMGFDTGLATGSNAGMARGLGRYILVLDPNTVLAPGALRTLVEFADRHPSAGLVAPRLRSGQGRPQSTTDKGDRRGYEVRSAPSTAMLVPRVVHAATAGFDEDFFSWWADVDWCRRIRAAGYSVWCVPAAVVVHHDPPGAELTTVKDYHDGAYRYWRKHDAPAAWHPRYWVEVATLRIRAISATRQTLRRHPEAPPRSPGNQPRRAQPQF